MGCAGNRVVNDVVTANRKKNNPIFEIQAKIKNMIRSNPFTRFTLDKFKQIIFTNTKNERGTKIDYYISELTTDRLTQAMLKDVLTLAQERLEIVYSKENYEENILMTLYFYLGRRNIEINEERKIFISSLLDFSRGKKENNTNTNTNTNIYSSGMFSFLILNIVKFLSYSFVFFFLSVGILQTVENFTRSQLETLFVDKEQVNQISPQHLPEYFASKLKEIKPEISPESITGTCLAYIFDPIKQIVNQNPNSEKVELKPEEISQIVERIEYLFDPYNMLELFVSLKIKNY